MPCFMNRAAGIIIATRLKHIGTTTCFLLIHWYVKSKLSAIQRRIAQCRVTFWDHGTTISTVVFCGANELCTIWITKSVRCICYFFQPVFFGSFCSLSSYNLENLNVFISSKKLTRGISNNIVPLSFWFDPF